MFCRICGYQLPPDALVCPRCGTHVETSEFVATPMSQPAEPLKNSGKGITAFVLSLVGIFLGLSGATYTFMGYMIVIACGVLGLIFSILAKKEISAKKRKGKGLATAALIISIVVLGISCMDIIGYMLDILFFPFF